MFWPTALSRLAEGGAGVALDEVEGRAWTLSRRFGSRRGGMSLAARLTGFCAVEGLLPILTPQPRGDGVVRFSGLLRAHPMAVLHLPCRTSHRIGKGKAKTTERGEGWLRGG